MVKVTCGGFGHYQHYESYFLCVRRYWLWSWTRWYQNLRSLDLQPFVENLLYMCFCVALWPQTVGFSPVQSRILFSMMPNFSGTDSAKHQKHHFLILLHYLSHISTEYFEVVRGEGRAAIHLMHVSTMLCNYSHCQNGKTKVLHCRFEWMN